jgi:hypothetical protein
MTLVGLPYGGGFGLVVSSTRDEPLAQRALLESARLDRVEAPQKELDLRAKQVAEAEARDEKSRLVNKPEFRPGSPGRKREAGISNGARHFLSFCSLTVNLR